MNRTKTFILIPAIIAVISVCIYSMAATITSNGGEFYDFENKTIPASWNCYYGNAVAEIAYEDSNGDGNEDENENHYLKLSYSYNSESGRNRTYYDFKVKDINTNHKGIVQADYDVMYTEITSDKNGEIQFKLRTGPGEDETSMVARVLKNQGYFRTQNSAKTLYNIRDINNKDLAIVPEHWYSVKLIVDLENGKQTTYIFDRDTQELLSYSDPIDTIANNTSMNAITFSSSTDMCIDNLRISYLEADYVQIIGKPHISSSTNNKYYVVGKDYYDNITALPTGTTIEWSLASTPRAVSMGTTPGVIKVDSNPEIGPVILQAKIVTSNNSLDYTQNFVVYVSK